MRRRKALKIVLTVVPVLLVAFAVGAVSVLRSTDFNRYKPQIAAEVKRATGRDLDIAGNLAFEISFNPALAVEGITLANAEWGARPDMMALRRLEAQVAILPLFLGKIEIDRLVLVGADILLEVDAEGRANFDFARAGETAATGKPGGEIGIPVGAREVLIEDSVLAYADASSGAQHRLRIERLSLSGESMSDPVALVFRGDYNGERIEADGRFGTPKEMMSAGRPWPVELTMRGGGATLSAKGSVAEPAMAGGVALSISAGGAEFADIARLAGSEMPPAGAWTLTAELLGDANTVLGLKEIRFDVAGNDIAGDLSVDLSGERSLLEAQLRSERFDLSAFGAAASPQTPQSSGERLFPDAGLPLTALRVADAKLQFDAKELGLGGARMNDLSIGATLEGGKLSVNPLAGRFSEGALGGRLLIDATGEKAAIDLALSLDKVNLGALMNELHVTEAMQGHANIKIDIAGSGKSVAGVMAGLDGEAVMVMGRGQVRSASLQTLIGGPTQVLSKIFSGEDSDLTAINCAVMRFPVRKGVATAEPMLLDTDVATFVGKGTVDLGSEALKLTITPDVKKTTISAAVPVRIDGTLAAPSYSLEKTAVARKIGGLLGIVLFPPAAIIGLGELGASDDNPCLQQARAGQTAPAKDDAEDAGGPGRLLKGAGEGITKGLKGLFGQ